MCGIVAILDPTRDADALRRDAERMADALAHRGPDDAGVWCDPDAGVALGHRRLAIRDPSPVGHQPMHSADGRWVLAYNGELYNPERLRAWAPDHHFRGGSDTEVLLEALARRGVRATLAAANGMFALAAWDRAERRLWLGRDHVGIKPLHHAWTGHALLCASELRALRTCQDFPTELDEQAAAQMLDCGVTVTPRTIYRAARKLPPGTLLTAVPGAPASEPSIWWDAESVAVAAQAAPGRADTEVVADLEALLLDGVERQMASDVPLGAFLSGGIDSSLVVALMQARSTRPVQTFAIGFDDPRFDEAPHAAAVAAALGTDHTELRVGEAELLDVLPRALAISDEPFGDSSLLPTLLVSSLARRSVTVALSGDGGDELFGGYTTYRHAEQLWGTLRRVPWPVRRSVAGLAGGARTDLLCRWAPRLLPGRDPEQVVSRVERGLGALPGRSDVDVLERLSTRWPTAASPLLPHVAVARSHEMARPGRPVMPFFERMMLSDQQGYLPDTILTKVDRAAMSVGLEVRVPLLDPRVVALAWGLRPEQRVRDGRQKWALREVLDRYVPRALVDRPKQGFQVPLGAWLRGPLRPWAEDLLAPTELAQLSFLDAAAVRRTWAQHLAGRPRQDGLWNLLMLLAWRRAWG
jgi:asparagine synthase (glutamine-hydrolysing)